MKKDKEITPKYFNSNDIHDSAQVVGCKDKSHIGSGAFYGSLCHDVAEVKNHKSIYQANFVILVDAFIQTLGVSR